MNDTQDTSGSADTATENGPGTRNEQRRTYGIVLIAMGVGVGTRMLVAALGGSEMVGWGVATVAFFSAAAIAMALFGRPRQAA